MPRISLPVVVCAGCSVCCAGRACKGSKFAHPVRTGMQEQSNKLTSVHVPPDSQCPLTHSDLHWSANQSSTGPHLSHVPYHTCRQSSLTHSDIDSGKSVNYRATLIILIVKPYGGKSAHTLISLPPPPQAAADREQLCAVCWERRKDTVFQCGHATCAECGDRLVACCICRQRISIRIRMY